MQLHSRTTDIPEYHEGMLLVQARPSSMQPTMAGLAMSVSAAMAGETVLGVSSTTGLAALAFFERAGMIKRVVPISRFHESFETPVFAESLATGRSATAAVMAVGVASPTSPVASANGLSLIELEHEEHREKLQLALASDPNIASVSRVPVRYLVTRATRKPAARRAPTIAASPPSPAVMWNLSKIRWAEARAVAGFADANDIDVAVLDTGVDTGHPDLQGQIFQYINQHPDLPSTSSPQDIIGHGTHVSGTIAALINNGFGINGICTCRLNIWKIFSDVPDLVNSRLSTTFEYFVNPAMYLSALIDCISAKPKVINLSIGGTGKPSAPELEAFQHLIQNGTTVVAAMGNERIDGSPISYPAAIPGVIAVGATSLDDSVANFSNRGNHISLSAPGAAIWSTLPTYPGQSGFDAVQSSDGSFRQGKAHRRETNYDAWNGTSMATPHVTASVALYLSNGGKSDPASIRRALIETADKVPGMSGASFHPDYGYGRLNLLKLVQRARAGL